MVAADDPAILAVSVSEDSARSNRVSESGDTTLDALGRLALHVLPLALRSWALVVPGSREVYVGAAVPTFEVYVGGLALCAESRRVLMLALEAKRLSLRMDMVVR